MRPRHLVALALLVFSCAAVAGPPVPARASSLPSGFHDQVVFSGLEEPTTARFAADGKVFVAEKTGKILVYDSLTDPTPTLFADLRTDVYDTGDRGLLGLALDPEFPTRPYVYALYTYDHLLGAAETAEEEAPKWGQPNHSGDGCEDKPSGTGVDACPVSGRLVRLTANGDEATENGKGEVEQKVLVEGWCAQFSSHSIGDLQFDSAGNLYASGGDGSDANNVDFGELGWPQPNECGDPPAGLGGKEEPPTAEGGALRAQDARTPNPLGLSADPTDLNGSLIKIDPETGLGLPSNPLYAGSLDPNERRILAYGFRNPFRFAIDPLHDEIYVDNVGWNAYEEMDRLAIAPSSVFNSGWPCYEGPKPNPSYQSLGLNLCKGLYAEPGAVTPPFFYYKHGVGVTPEDDCPTEEGAAISGISFYESGSYPSAYDGSLFFADPVRGCMYVMFPGVDGRPDPTTTTLFMSDAGRYPGVDIETGPEGDLYYVSLFSETSPGEEFGPGAVHRISYDPEAPEAVLTATPQWGAASIKNPLDVHLDAGGSSDPKGKSLGYEWDLDGNGSFEVVGGAERTVNLTKSQNVEIAVRVSDGTFGAPGTHSSVAKVTVYPGDTPPVPVIETPSPSLEWHVGQEIGFSGSAQDAEDGGGLGPASLFWKSRLYHCPSKCHVHPLQTYPAVASGALVAPDHDYPSHLELSLTAVDSRGLAASTAVQIYPREVDLRLATDPPGLTISAGLTDEATPFTLHAIESGAVTLSAPQTEQMGGKTYTWQSWSDGGARVHSVSATPGGAYTAVYATEPLAGEEPEPPIPPPPATALHAHPRSLTAATTAKFVFSSNSPGARFRCRLDGGEFKPCSSPRTFRHLSPGLHRFRVFALAPNGERDPSPAKFEWRLR